MFHRLRHRKKKATYTANIRMFYKPVTHIMLVFVSEKSTPAVQGDRTAQNTAAGSETNRQYRSELK